MKKILKILSYTLLVLLYALYVIYVLSIDKEWLVCMPPIALFVILMFIGWIGIKKDDKRNKKIITDKIHPILGEIRYGGISWDKSEKEKILLWNNTYEIPASFIADTPFDDVSEQQLTALEKFYKVVVEQRKQIEELIMDYIECTNKKDCIQKFIPVDIMFSKNGTCVLRFQDPEVEYNEDVDTEIALYLLPEFKLEGAEEALETLFSDCD